MPQAAPPSGGSQQTPGSMGIIWVIVGIFLLLWASWFFGHTLLVKIFFQLKLFEINVIQFFVDVLADTKSFILNSDPAQASFPQVVNVASMVGYYLRIPIALLLLLMAVVLYFKSSIVKYRQTYDMKKLLLSATQVWPQEAPVVGLRLAKHDINEGPWAMALSPMMFAKKNKLLKPPQDTGETVISRSSKQVATILKDKASKVFVAQMGRLWEGPMALNIHTRALYAAFATKSARKADEARDFLYKIAASARTGKLDFSGTNALLRKYKDFPAVKNLGKKHAYVLTVMASLLQLSRSDGVLSSADFLWLKPIDRKLWFMLNAVGRQTVTTEVAGPFAHWLSEKELGKAIKAPMIDEAVKGLEEAISNIIYKA